MKEFIEKLIGGLEEREAELKNITAECKPTKEIRDKNYGYYTAMNHAKEIVNQLAEEYNNGWIPVSSGNPKETGLYQVTVDDNDEPVITAMYLAEVDIWSYHAGYGNYMKVLAWRSLPQPYQPKGE